MGGMSSARALDAILGELRADADRRAELRSLLLDGEPNLGAALDRLTEQVSALTAAQQRSEERLDRLTDAMTALATRMGALSERVDSLRGWSTERKYVDKGNAYFQRIARRLRVLQPSHLDQLLDPLEAAGTLTEDEADEIRVADAVFSGRLRPHALDGYLVVEVSVLVDVNDVDRAAARARLLRRTGQPVLAVVAGEGVTERAAVLAQEANVWQVTNGTVRPPPETGRPRDLVGA